MLICQIWHMSNLTLLTDCRRDRWRCERLPRSETSQYRCCYGNSRKWRRQRSGKISRWDVIGKYREFSVNFLIFFRPTSSSWTIIFLRSRMELKKEELFSIIYRNQLCTLFPTLSPRWLFPEFSENFPRNFWSEDGWGKFRGNFVEKCRSYRFC